MKIDLLGEAFIDFLKTQGIETVDVTPKRKPKKLDQVKLFLEQSNNIEDVWDKISLKQAKKAWDYLIKQPELTISDILQTHAILMEGKLDPDDTGAFRRGSVWIGGHEAKPWFAIPELMAQWIIQAQGTVELAQTGFKGSRHNSIENLVKDDHVAFEAIHPFIDGNGRMGRILLNWQRVKVGLPILVIYEKEKWDYYEWFQK